MYLSSDFEMSISTKKGKRKEEKGKVRGWESRRNNIGEPRMKMTRPFLGY